MVNAQYKKGALEICVLSQLVGQDRYGYELTENISKTMTIAGGTLYPILRKLKEDDLVTTYLVDTGSGPARKYYRLTEKGRARQIQLKEEWESFTRAVQTLMECNTNDGGSSNADSRGEVSHEEGEGDES